VSSPRAEKPALGSDPSESEFDKLTKHLIYMRKLKQEDLLPSNVYEDSTKIMAADFLKKIGYYS
jgi:hypothetical protein